MGKVNDKELLQLIFVFIYLKFLRSQVEGYWSCSFIAIYTFEHVIGMQIWFKRLGKQQHLKLGQAAFTVLLQVLVWL